MNRIIRFAMVPVALAAAACGGSASSPTAPTSMAAFTIGSGSYSLQLSGSGSCSSSSTNGAPAAPTDITIKVSLAPSGNAWALSVPGQSLNGRVTSDGLNASMAIKGSASFGTVRFFTDNNGETELTLGGSARNGDRYEGIVTSGRAVFESLGGIGTSSALCTGGTFTLRRAS